MSIYHEIKIGSHVVCINDGIVFNAIGNLSGLTKGKVYTVRYIGPLETKYLKLYPSLYSRIDPKIFIKVEELRKDSELDVPYWALRFRPLQKLTVENFLNVKTPISEKITERA